MNFNKLTRSAKLLASIHTGLILTKRQDDRSLTTVRFPEGDLSTLKKIITDEIGKLDIRFITIAMNNGTYKVKFYHNNKPALTGVLHNVHNNYLNTLENN